MAKARREALAEAEVPDGDESLRLCAATRAKRSPDDLIRFVAAPDARIIPDLGRKLPGRGVWVTADRDSVATAVRTKAFARSLKAQVEASADLPDMVESLLTRRACDALSLASKAGLVVTGFTKVDALVASGKAVALLHGSDAAADGRDKLDRKHTQVSRAADTPARIVDALTIEQMSLAMGRSNVVHAALTHGGAADRFLVEAARLARFRSGVVTSDEAPTPSPNRTENA